MELSKEVHGLLERIKRLSQQAQHNESYSTLPIDLGLNTFHRNFVPITSELIFTFDDLIPVDEMDFSDDERWLHVSENSMINPYTGDLNEWLRQGFYQTEEYSTNYNTHSGKLDMKKNIDTRTFTRPKKRISRPSLERFTENYGIRGMSRNVADSYHRNNTKMNMSGDDSQMPSELYQQENFYPGGNMHNTGPVHFKLSEPVYNSSFDRILATANDSIDSFQNMSPPSLINSLCSSTFTTLMDSGYVNQDNVPNDNNEALVAATDSLVLNENNDPNITYTPDISISKDEKDSKMYKDASLNATYDAAPHNKIAELNSTFSKTRDLNATFQRNISNKSIAGYNLSGSNTITKKNKSLNLTNSFKASCPDINRTFLKSRDFSLDLTYQKLSDSQPNLTEDLKRTILNQSMELMHPTVETFHSARSGSADSLDERSSSISNSSKESSSKILNMGDLDYLAKVQEERLQQAMSTPKPMNTTRSLLMQGDVISPIQNRLADEQYLSDSDMSDSCVTARSGLSKRSSSSNSPKAAPFTNRFQRNTQVISRSELDIARQLTNNPEVSQPSLRTLPTMVVKPMEVNRTMVQPARPLTAQSLVRPKVRLSGLPRPTTTSSSTGIPRPTSRIPGPKSLRPPSSRSGLQPPARTDWMDGCY